MRCYAFLSSVQPDEINKVVPKVQLRTGARGGCYTPGFMPKNAAAVILYRESPELEVQWVRRSRTMFFQGGYYAFPGGQAEADETMEACAARELEEELGVAVDPADLLPAGRWLTPAFAPRRFDTSFFIARCPAGVSPAIQSTELDLAEWVRPADALALWNEGDLMTAPPIRHALSCLADGLEGIDERITADPRAKRELIPAIEMRKGIVLVPVRTPTLPPATHTNCYIIGDEELIVIDPASGYPEEQAILDSVLESMTAEGRKVREVWLTHRHSDHVGGAHHVSERWGAPIAAHAITADELDGLVRVDRHLEDGETFVVPGNPDWIFRVIHTPGHARGHVCVFEESRRTLITGDLMAGFGTIVIDPPEGHMATYLESLERMAALEPTALFFAHGPASATASEKLRGYIDHRLEREANILEAWQAGKRDPGAIVPEVYTDVHPKMWGLAERSVSAHLEKLQEEGKI